MVIGPLLARHWQRSAAAFLCLTMAACGSSGPQLHPVRGQVFYLEKPADGALVVFHPVGGAAEALRPSGVVGADGSFSLGCRTPDDGAPAGDYVVAIVWYDQGAKIDEKNSELKNRLPEKYADARQSPLRAQVKPGPNQLEPMRLK